MKITTLLTTLFTLSFGLNSVLAFDVVPKKLKHGSTYVRVTNPTPNTVKFEECIFGYESNGCTQIGKKSSYSKKDLISQRNIENAQIFGAIAADVAILGGLIFGGAYMGAVAGAYSGGTLASFTPVFIGSVTGGTAGTAVGGSLLSTVDCLDPFEQTEQAKAINTEVIEDEKVIVDNIDEYIERLELILSKV